MRTARALHRMALLTATMLALTACDAGQQAVVQTELSADPKTSLMLADDIARSVEIDVLPVQVSGGDRMVIYNANMTVVVSEPLESIENISGLASELGGFVVHTEVYHTEGLDAGYGDEASSTPEAHITIRVLAEKLDEAIARISEMAVDVRGLSRSGQDVTQDYTDLSSRLHNMEAAEAKLLEIMDTAQRSEDVLEVFRELMHVGEQIEVLRGQMLYFEQSARLSSLSVRLLPDVGAQPISVEVWKPLVTLKSATETLLNGLYALGDILIYMIVTVLPIVLIVAVPVYFGGRELLRRRRRKKTLRTDLD